VVLDIGGLRLLEIDRNPRDGGQKLCTKNTAKHGSNLLHDP
jgi:hypothetical protein